VAACNGVLNRPTSLALSDRTRKKKWNSNNSFLDQQTLHFPPCYRALFGLNVFSAHLATTRSWPTQIRSSLWSAEPESVSWSGIVKFWEGG
jgi:hypothetical protein